MPRKDRHIKIVTDGKPSVALCNDFIRLIAKKLSNHSNAERFVNADYDVKHLKNETP